MAAHVAYSGRILSESQQKGRPKPAASEGLSIMANIARGFTSVMAQRREPPELRERDAPEHPVPITFRHTKKWETEKAYLRELEFA